MEQNVIFAQRLKNARVMRGYSMDDLVSKMGNSITKMTISKYESCQMFPNSSTLISLSKALDQPVDYFFRPLTVKIDSIRFRKTKSKLSIRQENSIKENISDMIERYLNIEEVCNASSHFSIPDSAFVASDEHVKTAALKLREAWNIGEDGIVNVIGFLEDNGIKVLEIDAAKSFDGLSSMVNEKYPVVVLNRAFSSERKRLTALHELGHLILNFDSSVSEKEEEHFCNLFASEMLIPEKTFKREVGDSRKDISYQELRSLQLKYGISCDALMYKAQKCKVISNQSYRSFCVKKNSIPAYKEMIERSLYRAEESCRFPNLVYRALSNELITTSKAASLLNVSVDKIREAVAFS